MNLSSTLRTARSVITANSPVLLTGTAIVGVFTTAVLAARGGYKARGIIDEAQLKQVEPLTVQDKVKLTWLCYAAPGVTSITTIASVVGVHTIHTKRHAALAGLYAVTSTKMDDYQKKAEELLGSKKSQQINDEMAQAGVDRVPIKDHEVIVLDDGSELCFDDWSGRYFMGSMPIIERAVNNINMQLKEDGDASLNDFYDMVGLPPIPMGQHFGWSGAKIEAKFGGAVTRDGRSAISFWFQDLPKDNLGRS